MLIESAVCMTDIGDLNMPWLFLTNEEEEAFRIHHRTYFSQGTRVGSIHYSKLIITSLKKGHEFTLKCLSRFTNV